jgi:hypothetical protein
VSGSAASRLKRANKLLSKFYPPRGPKQWDIVLEAGEPIPEEIESQFQKGDHVFIREFPSGFLGPDEPIRCTAISWGLYERNLHQNADCITVERPRNGAPLRTIEEVGFAKQTSKMRV